MPIADMNKSKGHTIERCWKLKNLLAKKFTSGELCKLNLPPRQNLLDSKPRKRVDFIHRKSFRRKINSVSRPTSQSRRKITFSENDARGLNMPHDDVLIIAVDINDCEVARVLIDTSSTMDFNFFLDILKRMVVEGIQGSPELLSCFTGQSIMILETISLTLSIIGRSRIMEFMLVDSPSTYNVIPNIHGYARWKLSFQAIISAKMSKNLDERSKNIPMRYQRLKICSQKE